MIILAALAVRIYLQLLALLAIKLIPFKASFPFWDINLISLGPAWLWLWGNFDGVYYLFISQLGYQYGLTQAFFPAYPILIKYLTYLTHNNLWSALIISHLSLIAFLYFFIKLGLLDYSQKTIRWAVLLLLLFPTSFFFFSVYTESLFLFLVALSFYLSRQKKFLLASLVVGLASATRLVGILLILPLIWEYWQSSKKRLLPRLALYSALSFSGLISYLWYLEKRFNDWLMFIHSQPGFGAGRQVDKLIMPYQVIVRYIKMFFGVAVSNEIYPVLVFEFVVAMAFFCLVIWALVKKFRTSYLSFIIPALLLPTFTGSFSSMPRYVLVGFPLFYFLAAKTSKPQKIALLVIFFLLLSWAFIRFARGYWLA